MDRKNNIAEASALLVDLLKDVCPRCATQDVLYCEIVDGEHQHVSGVCEGSAIRELLTHLDDVRDQFANEFNPDELPRARWGYSVVLDPRIAVEKSG